MSLSAESMHHMKKTKICHPNYATLTYWLPWLKVTKKQSMCKEHSAHSLPPENRKYISYVKGTPRCYQTGRNHPHPLQIGNSFTAEKAVLANIHIYVYIWKMVVSMTEKKNQAEDKCKASWKCWEKWRTRTRTRIKSGEGGGSREGGGEKISGFKTCNC